MKKKLNIDAITNELEGASLFFTRSTSPIPSELPVVEKDASTAPQSPIEKMEPVHVEKPKRTSKPKAKVKTVNNDDTVIPRYHDTTVSRYQDTTTPSIHGVSIEIVRKAVKEFGKEAATHRFTIAEKKELTDLIYTYKNQGTKTSENEITRIAVNFIMKDYKENGENSVLHKILQALNE